MAIWVYPTTLKFTMAYSKWCIELLLPTLFIIPKFMNTTPKDYTSKRVLALDPHLIHIHAE